MLKMVGSTRADARKRTSGTPRTLRAVVSAAMPPALRWPVTTSQYAILQQRSPVQLREIRKHSLAASAAGRALPSISRSVNTNSRTRASNTDRNASCGCGFATTASNTIRARGCNDAAHEFAAVRSACAPCAAHRLNNAIQAIVCFIPAPRHHGGRAPRVATIPLKLFISGYRRSP
jgi:hypothetical protein